MKRRRSPLEEGEERRDRCLVNEHLGAAATATSDSLSIITRYYPHSSSHCLRPLTSSRIASASTTTALEFPSRFTRRRGYLCLGVNLRTPYDQ
ncbi:hypothetical protein ACFX12_003744 [Malus domestica]